MKILSLDPGITTGYALLEPDGDLVESGNIDADEIVDSILTKFANDPEVIVVQENIPIPTMGQMNVRLLLVINQLQMLFPHPVKVVPGQWKSNPMIFNYPFPSDKFPSSTPHQRDAFRLGIFYITFLYKVSGQETHDDGSSQTESLDN